MHIENMTSVLLCLHTDAGHELTTDIPLPVFFFFNKLSFIEVQLIYSVMF